MALMEVVIVLLAATMLVAMLVTARAGIEVLTADVVVVMTTAMAISEVARHFNLCDHYWYLILKINHMM